MLNMLGFACYSAYNVALFCVPAVQHEYVHAYSKNIPVGLEDVAFSVHAALITAATLAQCVCYDRGGQPLFSWVGRTAAGIGAAALAGCALVGWAEASGTPGRFSWLNFLLLLSAIKLVVTLTKYIPQVRSLPVCTPVEFLLDCQTTDINELLRTAVHCPFAHHEGAMRNRCRPRPQGMRMEKARRPRVAPSSGTPSHLRTQDASMCTVQVVMNIRRRSTAGWSIHNVLLDFTGGTTSLVQLLLQCAVQSDWSQIAGNPVKFGLGFISLFFDVTFMVQHYVIYREPQEAAAEPSAVEAAASCGASPDEGQGLLPEQEGEGSRQEPLDEV